MKPFLKTCGYQNLSDDPHSFLSIIRSMGTTEQASGEDLSMAERVVHLSGCGLPEYPIDRDHKHESQGETYQRRKYDECQCARPFAKDKSVKTSLRDSRSGITANQRMRRADRQTHVPGEQIPGHGSH